MESKEKYEIEKGTHYKPKKYVFKVYPENINKIDHLEPRERDDFINQAIEDYVNQFHKEKFRNETLDKAKNFMLYAIVLLLILPFVAYFIKESFSHSTSTNKQMQYNFEKLFKHYNLK